MEDNQTQNPSEPVGEESTQGYTVPPSVPLADLDLQGLDMRREKLPEFEIQMIEPKDWFASTPQILQYRLSPHMRSKLETLAREGHIGAFGRFEKADDSTMETGLDLGGFDKQRFTSQSTIVSQRIGRLNREPEPDVEPDTQQE